MAICNVVFDIGNVVVPWDPEAIVHDAFGEERVARKGFVSPLAGNSLWLAVNRGEHTLAHAKRIYVAEQGFEEAEIDRLYDALFASMVPIDETVLLMRELRAAGYRIFAITDNVNEAVAYQQSTYDFWDMIEAAAISSEVGVLKPDERMYRHLLDKASLAPEECLFFDDAAANVEGARTVGMNARLFTDAAEARSDLTRLGVRF